MCFLISIEAPHEFREQLVVAASLACRSGVRIEVAHPSRWPWARERPVSATLTEDGGCSCSLLADDADWNARAWSLRADVAPKVAAALQTLLEQGPPVIRVTALWLGDKPERVEQVDADQLVALVDANELGTKTAYIVERR